MYFKWLWTSHAMHIRHYAIWLGNTSPQASVCVYIYIMLGIFNYSWFTARDVSSRITPQREVQNVLDEVDELQDPLLDNLYIKTLSTHDVNS